MITKIFIPFQITKDLPVKPLIIADRKFNSRLLVGTGKFPSGAIMRDSIEASNTNIVKVINLKLYL